MFLERDGSPVRRQPSGFVGRKPDRHTPLCTQIFGSSSQANDGRGIAPRIERPQMGRGGWPLAGATAWRGTVEVSRSALTSGLLGRVLPVASVSSESLGFGTPRCWQR
jgi:hypothetical protein